jgi:hypothetical protein
MKKMIASLLSETHLVTPRRRVDWVFVLCVAGLTLASSILMTVLAVR